MSRVGWVRVTPTRAGSGCLGEQGGCGRQYSPRSYLLTFALLTMAVLTPAILTLAVRPMAVALRLCTVLLVRAVLYALTHSTGRMRKARK